MFAESAANISEEAPAGAAVGAELKQVNLHVTLWFQRSAWSDGGMTGG